MMENMMIATRHNTRKLIGHSILIAGCMLSGALGAALVTLLTAASG